MDASVTQMGVILGNFFFVFLYFIITDGDITINVIEDWNTLNQLLLLFIILNSVPVFSIMELVIDNIQIANIQYKRHLTQYKYYLETEKQPN